MSQPSSNGLRGLLREIEEGDLLAASFSSPWKKDGVLKISARPLLLKGALHYQLSTYEKQKVSHRNLLPQECGPLFYHWCSETFRQAIFTTKTAAYHILANRNKQLSVIKKLRQTGAPSLAHNRAKQHILSSDTPIPFLIELGVMKADGGIIAKKYDKFCQINRFIELVDDLFESHLRPALTHSNRLKVVDLGCGKSYLTFALYHYLREIKQCPVDMLGIDLKEDLIEQCRTLAKKLGCEGMEFVTGDISHMPEQFRPDLVIALHACDTATDAVLAKAIACEAEVILAVPCCQHELYTQIKNETLGSLMRYGILKERLAALVTDAARAELLTLSGYDVQVLEFIEMEHTAKNLLIRAVKAGSTKKNSAAQKRYADLKNALQICPALERKIRA